MKKRHEQENNAQEVSEFEMIRQKVYACLNQKFSVTKFTKKERLNQFLKSGRLYDLLLIILVIGWTSIIILSKIVTLLSK